MNALTLVLAAVVVAAAVYALARRLDVRLVLLLAALALGALAGAPAAIVRTFLATLTRDQFVVPICCAVGFAYVLRHTGCDEHLVHALARPLRSARVLLVPGAVLLGFAVNVPVVSQAGTAVSIGAVLVPLLHDARVAPATAGAAILLGASLGGGLLNPGAPEWRTVSSAAGVSSAECIAHAMPLMLVQLVVATCAFWVVCRRLDGVSAAPEPTRTPSFHVSPWKAAVPLVPIVLLFLAGPPLHWLQVPEHWLVDPQHAADRVSFDSRLIGAAMLVGVAVAALVARRTVGGIAKAFFEGAGYGYATIISVIVVATCFGKGIELIGVDALVGRAAGSSRGALFPVAGALPAAFAALCGSGMATTQSLFPFFVAPARHLGAAPAHIGALVAIAAAAGRTISPVAAITLLSASLTKAPPLALLARVFVPVVLATSITVLVAYGLAR